MCPYSIQGNPIFSIKKLCVSNKISSLNRSYNSLTSIIGTSYYLYYPGKKVGACGFLRI